MTWFGITFQGNAPRSLSITVKRAISGRRSSPKRLSRGLRSIRKGSRGRFGISVTTDAEPVNFLEQNFEQPVDISRLAFELEVSPDVLSGAIRRSDPLGRTLGIVVETRGAVTRQTLAEQFPVLAAELGRDPR